jgi:hypothetical protein
MCNGEGLFIRLNVLYNTRDHLTGYNEIHHVRPALLLAQLPIQLAPVAVFPGNDAAGVQANY